MCLLMHVSLSKEACQGFYGNGVEVTETNMSLDFILVYFKILDSKKELFMREHFLPKLPAICSFSLAAYHFQFFSHLFVVGGDDVITPIMAVMGISLSGKC